MNCIEEYLNSLQNKKRIEFKNIPSDVKRYLDRLFPNLEIREQLFRYFHSTTDFLCTYKDCGQPLKFISYKKGYTSGCCLQHSQKLTMLEKYGVENPSLLAEAVEKRNSTMLEKYGVINPFQSEEIKDRIKSANLERHGFEHNSQRPETKEKRKSNNLLKYGVEHVTQLDEINEKRKATCLAKYGDTEYFRTDEFKSKSKKTLISKYGVDHFSKHSAYYEKVISTSISRYGVEHFNQYSPKIEKNKSTMLERYGFTSNFSKSNRSSIESTWFEKYDCYPAQSDIVKAKTLETNMLRYGKPHPRKNMFDQEYLKSVIADNPTSYAASILDVSGSYVLKKAKEFGLQTVKNISAAESDLFNSIEIDEKIQSDRSILDGKELDIYIPSKKIAIEFDGLFWHSELHGKDKNYHLKKTERCLEKGIQLIHVFESEFVNKRNIVLSVINAKLGIFKQRIYARQCVVKELSNSEKSLFLEANHIQGNDNSKLKYGLYHGDILVSVMTFGKSRFTGKYEFEMHRYANKLGYQVVGGASKLWKYFLNAQNPNTVVTYADRRYSKGDLYSKLGFDFSHSSSPQYHYFKNGLNLMNRLNFQKHKLCNQLDVYDPNLTEWGNMIANGYDRIWDCGHNVYVYRKDQDEKL